jgi:NodT family efflux transporter outer membrane factor (OMF) lipoprotein
MLAALARGVPLAPVFAGIALVQAGCAVGPDYKAPAAPTATVYDTSNGVEGEKEIKPAAEQAPNARDVEAQWWALFSSSRLNETMRLAIAQSPTLPAARKTLEAAYEAIAVARAGYLPRINAVAGAQRGGTQLPGLPEQSGTTWSGGLSASYSLNALGGSTRRFVEEQQANADYYRYQLAAAYLTLTGNVAIQALTSAAVRLQIEATKELIADDEKNLALTQREFEAGAAARTDVLTAASQLAADEANLPSLYQQLDVARHALAVLVGKAPGEWKVPAFELADFRLPAALPLSLPAVLVRQRPDVLSAEAELRAGSAAIGVAVAQEFPSISLTGSFTRQALTAADLFHDFERLWSAGGTVTQPLFQGGALRAQVREARDTFDAQAALYEQTVLQAFQQVADSLRAVEHDSARVAAYRRSLKIAEESLVLQRKSYAAGKTTVLQLIDAERTYSQAKLGSATADASQLEDAVNLFVALGGGWWNAQVAEPR